MEPELVHRTVEITEVTTTEPSPPPDSGEDLDAVESNFLPGTNVQWAWDATALSYLKTCPRLYQYIIIEGWESKEESVNLRFGGEVHTSMQEYAHCRAAGLNHEESLLQVVKSLVDRTYDFAPDMDTKAGKYKNRNSLIRTVIHYLDNYNLDVEDPAATLIKDDGLPAAELSFRFELDFGPNAQTPVDETNSAYNGRPYTLCGHLDRVVTFNDDLFVMDYKTTTMTPGSYFFDQFEPNNQMTLYTLASKVVLDAPVKGVIIDAIQLLKEPPYTRSVRSFTYRNEDQLDEWLKDAAFWFGLAEHYAENNYWPQNDTACSMYGGCRFRKICSKAPSVREKFLTNDFVRGERWNPLKTR